MAECDLRAEMPADMVAWENMPSVGREIWGESPATSLKLLILSDLHVEFAPFEPEPAAADVIILAGDIHIGRKGLEWAQRAFADKPVIYVLGNHEYYGASYPKHVNALKAAARGSNVYVLENDNVTIDGVRFLGCTLWTDFALFGDPRIAGYEATQKMTDFKRIRMSENYRKMRSIDAALINKRSRDWLKQQLALDVGTTVVVTHHAPSARSLPECYENDILAAAYVSHCDELVASSGAALWVHGHLHSQSDYLIGSTRVVCNPRGYPDEKNEDFVPGLLVEVAGN
ncbi:MAG: putative metallophosphoesterase [Rhodocyclales bacterium]|nr:putative metallophosphoesterase [Rhodocyclales bacterium]